MIVFFNPYGPFATNAILLGCPKTKSAAVIDPAMGACAPLIQKAEERGLIIQKIILTHSHWDHFVDAAELVEKTKAPVFVHPLDAENLEEPGSDGLPLFFPLRAVKPDHFLQEGVPVMVGALELEVIHTPGHSPGSVCFYLREQKVLISGDTLFKGSIGNLHLATGHADSMWPSLRKLAKLPPDTRVIPGHGDETTIGREHWLNRAKEMFS